MASNPKPTYTDGPWHFEYTDPGETETNFVLSNIAVDADEEGRTCDYGGSILEGMLVLANDAENEANARLIAAAPDLLAACELLVRTFGDLPGTTRQQAHGLWLARGAIILALDGEHAALMHAERGL